MNIVSTLLFLFASFSKVFSIKPKFCVNCKYNIPDTVISTSNPKFSKCALFPKSSDDNNSYLVTGDFKLSLVEYHYCSTARDQESMCGQKGTEYKKKRISKSYNFLD